MPRKSTAAVVDPDPFAADAGPDDMPETIAEMWAAPAAVWAAGETRIANLPVGSIQPSPYQVRSDFDEQQLQDLAASLKAHGLLQPITVRKLPGGYELIAGERRLRAARLASLETIPAVVRECSDDQAAELCLLENLQRQDLNPIEEARGYRLLSDRGMTQTEIGERVGRSQSAIANAIRLLKLPEPVQDFIAAGKLSPSHGVHLLRFADFPPVCLAIAKYAAEYPTPVRELEYELPLIGILRTEGVVRGISHPLIDAPEFQICRQCPFGAARQPYAGTIACLKPDHAQELYEAYTARLQREEQEREERLARTAPVDQAGWTPREEAIARYEEYVSTQEARAALQDVTAPPAIDDDGPLASLEALAAMYRGASENLGVVRKIIHWLQNHGAADARTLDHDLHLEPGDAGCILARMEIDGIVQRFGDRLKLRTMQEIAAESLGVLQPAPGSSTVIEGHPAPSNDTSASPAQPSAPESTPNLHPSSTDSAPGPDPDDRRRRLVELLDRPGRMVSVDARHLAIALCDLTTGMDYDFVPLLEEIDRELPVDMSDGEHLCAWLSAAASRLPGLCKQVASAVIGPLLCSEPELVCDWLESLPEEPAEETEKRARQEALARDALLHEARVERDLLAERAATLEKQARAHQTHANEQHAAADKLKGELLELRTELKALKEKASRPPVPSMEGVIDTCRVCKRTVSRKHSPWNAADICLKCERELSDQRDREDGLASPSPNGHSPNGNGHYALSGEEQLIIRTLESAGGEAQIGTISNALGMDVSRQPGKRLLENLVRRGLVARRSDNVLALATAEVPA